MAIEWRHPLVTDLSKEGYNVLAEFEAALEGKSYRDACQIISTAGSAGTLGLLPNAHDPGPDGVAAWRGGLGHAQ